MRKSIISLMLALSAAAPTAAQGLRSDRPLDRVLAGRVAGPVQACIPLRPNTRSQIVGQTLVYRDGGTLYVNKPTTGVEWLQRDSILVTRPVVSQLCRNEPVQLVDRVSGFQRGFVTLGEFTPYTRPKTR